LSFLVCISEESEHFEFRHFRPHYLDVDTIFGDLRRECLHQHVVRNTILRKAPPSVVSGYGKRSINLNKVVATFEKQIFLRLHADVNIHASNRQIWYRHSNSEAGNDEIQNVQRV
jgi:hypothetical protein